MKKRLISALLVLAMLLTLLPFAAMAEEAGVAHIKSYVSNYPGGDKGMYVTSETTRVVAPDVTEQDVFFNSGDAEGQVAGFMTTVDLSGGNVKIKATYSGYYDGKDSSKWSVDKWGLSPLSEQAAAYEAATGERVVGGTNGDYFNMQTGQPLGPLVMNGVNCNPDNTAREAYFAILKDGTAVIRDKGTSLADVAEAIGSPFYLVKNGENMRDPADTSLIPGNSVGIDDEGRVHTFLADGRQQPYSRGITTYELAEIWIAQGVKNVLYLDGGGSATLLAEKDGGGLEMRNSGSDGFERTVSSGLLFVTTQESSGTFDHAAVFASRESIPAGGSFTVSAQCIDTKGFTMSDACTLALDEASQALGELKNGQFTSNGKTGTVKVNVLRGTELVGSKTVTVGGDSAGYAGFVNSGTAFSINGKLAAGWFAVGKKMYHADENGTLHRTTTQDTRGCTANGRIIGVCQTCGERYNGEALWAHGHKWNADYVCTVCGKQGISITKMEGYDKDGFVLKPGTNSRYYFTYTGSQIIQNIDNLLTYQGRKLSIRSSRTGKDALVTYGENTKVGIGVMTLEGRGDFYGTMELYYYITPAAVKNLRVSDVKSGSATLKWDAAPGAQNYMVEQNVNGTWKSVAETSATMLHLTDLKPETEYQYRVAWKAVIDKTYYSSVGSRPTVSFKTAEAMGDVSCTLPDGEKLSASNVGGDLYVFLPAGYDGSGLTLRAAEGSTVIRGDKGSANSGESFDLADIATGDNGIYSLTVSNGSETAELTVMCGDGIKTIFLTSDDKAAKGRPYVDAVKGNSATGAMRLLAPDGSTEVYNGALTQIKSRGNSSFTYADKKSYQIKLESKSDLLGKGEKGKTWVLLASYMDATAMHDKLYKDLAAAMGMEGTPDCDWVNLYYDGEYRGVYLLSEKAAVGKSTLNIEDMEDAYSEINEGYGDDMTVASGENAYGNKIKYTEGLTEPENYSGGYLIELNGARGIDDANGFKTAYLYEGKPLTFNVKSPEYLGKDAMEYISCYFQEFENAVYAQDEDGHYTGLNPDTGKYFYEYCDMDSLVKMFLVQHLAASPDAFHASLYFYKDKDGLLNIGPLWDMDLSTGTGMGADIAATNSYVCAYRYLSQALIQIPAFKQAVERYYNEEFYALAKNVINNKVDEYAELLDPNLAMNYVLWDMVRTGDPKTATHLYPDGTSLASVLSTQKVWLANRLTYTGKVVTHPHTYTTTVTESTCTDEGYTTHRCSVCGTTYKTDIVPALGHSYKATTVSATCEEGGYVEHVCTVCGDSYKSNQTNPLGHMAETTGAKAATCTEDGYTGDEVCMRCKETVSTGSVIPALGHNFVDGHCSRCSAVSNPFADVSESAVYFDAILWAYNHQPKQITGGYTTTEFRPGNPCSRGQVVTFLWRAAGEPEPGVENPFVDVENAGSCQPYYKAILWAYENGITTGFDATHFVPNGTVTRAQFVTFLWRYENKPEATGSIAGFPDAGDIASPYQTAVAWAVEKGITTGYEDGSFRPNAACTRWAVLLFMYRDLK